MAMGWCVKDAGRDLGMSEVPVYMYNITVVLLSSWCSMGVGAFLRVFGFQVTAAIMNALLI